MGDVKKAVQEQEMINQGRMHYLEFQFKSELAELNDHIASVQRKLNDGAMTESEVAVGRSHRNPDWQRAKKDISNLSNAADDVISADIEEGEKEKEKLRDKMKQVAQDYDHKVNIAELKAKHDLDEIKKKREKAKEQYHQDKAALKKDYKGKLAKAKDEYDAKE